MDTQNGNNKKLESAFDYSVKLIESGATIEDCLKLYPVQREELKDLLETTALLDKSYPESDVRPSKLFIKTDREKFLAAIEGGSSIISEFSPQSGTTYDAPSNVFHILKKAYTTLIASAAAMILITGGLVFTADNSLPGSVLYPIKRTAESVQLALTFDNAKKAELRYDFAEKRITEAKKLVKAGDTEEAARIYKEANENVAEAQKLAKASGQSDKGKEALDGIKSRVQPDGQKLANKDGGKTYSESDNKVAPTTTTTEQVLVAENTDAATDENKAIAERLAARQNRLMREESGTAENRTLASIVPFEVDSISVSNAYISPGRDHNNDSVTISVRDASMANFGLALYSGNTKITEIAKSDSNNIDAEWNGRTQDGGKIADGIYTIKAQNNIGQIAHGKTTIIIDTKAPEIDLVGPPKGISTNNTAPQFSWIASEDSVKFTLYLNPSGNMKAKTRCITGITGLSYDLTSDLEPGIWSWRVVATDKAGNIGSSIVSTLTVEDPFEVLKREELKAKIEQQSLTQNKMPTTSN